MYIKNKSEPLYPKLDGGFYGNPLACGKLERAVPLYFQVTLIPTQYAGYR